MPMSAGPAGTYLIGWPRRAVALQHPPRQAGAPVGATRAPGTPARGGRCCLRRGRCGRRGAAVRARPGSLPNQSLCRCFACALETRSPRSQVCAFGACGSSTKSLGTAKMPAGCPGVPAAPSQAAEPRLSCLRDAPKNHRQSPPPWPWSNLAFPPHPLEPPQHGCCTHGCNKEGFGAAERRRWRGDRAGGWGHSF